VCGWILIGTRPVSSNRKNCFAGDDTRSYRNFAALSGFLGCIKSLTHPVRVRFAFPSSCHDKDSRQTTENLTIGGALKHCQASLSDSVKAVTPYANYQFALAETAARKCS
jgi:hypothetical protein